MAATIDDKARTVLEATNFWHMATLMDDGTPQVSPVWADVEGNTVIVNTAVGRRKEKNLRRDPRVTLSTSPTDNPYVNYEIRGHVTDFIEGAPADEHINKMAKKYIGQDVYPYRAPGEERVILRIEPDKVVVPEM